LPLSEAETVLDGYELEQHLVLVRFRGIEVATGFARPGGADLGWGSVMRRSLRTVVVATAHPHRTELLDALLVHALGYDVIYVEPLAQAYSRIKQAAPDLIMIHSHLEDVAACGLRSMLQFDTGTAGIPVVTCAIHSADSIDDEAGAGDEQSPFAPIGAPMN
jgi:hypothetical protein